jgi:hypothetical protein
VQSENRALDVPREGVAVRHEPSGSWTTTALGKFWGNGSFNMTITANKRVLTKRGRHEHQATFRRGCKHGPRSSYPPRHAERRTLGGTEAYANSTL